MATKVGSIFIDFRAGVASFDKDMKAISRSLNRTSKDFDALGSSLTKSLTVPILAGTAAVFKAADSYQKAQKIIQVQTGATGDALKALQKDFDAVASSVPNSFGETATALSQVQVRTGETGEKLQELSKVFLELGNNTKTDLNANLQAGLTLFDAWGVEVNQQVETLNQFYRAAQLAGVPVTELMSTVGGVDAILGQFGFTLEESTALMVSFKRGGVDAEATVKGFGKAMKYFAENEITDAKGALEEILRQLQETPFSTELAAKAFKVFGVKLGQDMIDAAQEGRFEYQKYLDTILNGDQTILGAAAANRTFSEQLSESFNRINIAIAKGVSPEAFKNLNEQIKNLGESIAGTIDWFFKLPSAVQSATVYTVALGAATGPVLVYLGWILKNGAVVASYIGKIAKATVEWAAAQAILNTAMASGFISTLASAGGIIASVLVPALILAAGSFAIFATAVTLNGGSIGEAVEAFTTLFKTGFSVVVPAAIDLVKRAWSELIDFLFPSFDESMKRFSALLVSWGVGPETARNICKGIEDAFKGMRDTVNGFLDEVSNRWDTFWKNFERGKAVLKGPAALMEFDKAAAAAEHAASAVGQVEAAGKDLASMYSGVTSGLTEGFTKVEKSAAGAGNGANQLNNALAGTKQAAEAADKAIDGMLDSLESSKAQHNIDQIKDKIDEVAKTGSSADFGGNFQSLEQSLADSYYTGFTKGNEKATEEQLAKAKDAAQQQAAFEVGVYKNQVSKQQLEADKSRHEESVGFFSGLMEDAISGTRFDWEEQGKKAIVKLGSEWLTTMLEANGLFINSFESALNAILGLFGTSLSQIFGSIVSQLAGTAISSAATGAAATAAGSAAVTAGAGAATGAATTATTGTMSAAMSAVAPYVAAAAVVAWTGYSNFKNFGEWGSDTSNEQKGFDIGTAIIDVMAPGIGTVINKVFDGMIGGSKFTANQKSLKGFEKYVEDTLKESLGTALNFVVGDINQFDDGGWADKFWEEFGDKGGDTFATLGAAFEKLLGLEPGVGGQIGALLAQNLAGGDSLESLDNIKLFLDSMKLSVVDLSEAILQMGMSGEITWFEFESMRQSLEKIPTEGLAGIADLTGALDQVRDAGGRGNQALIGLRNLAVEAGESGATSLAQLQQQLLAAGEDADFVAALFQALGQRGINSIEDLKGASDASLGGVVADMQTLGVVWDDFVTETDASTQSVKNLADALNGLPTSKDIDINIHTNVSGDTNLDGVEGFAKGGIVWSPKLIKVGEKGPERITPLTGSINRRNVSAFGVGSGEGGSNYVIQIDATGAQAGVEHRILEAMQVMKDQAVMESIEGVSRASRRGVY